VTKTHAVYQLSDGDTLDIRHHGRQVTIGASETVLDIPPPPEVRPVTQPPGCEPRRRSRS
jgi:alpha,alpha-trehalose phosphorylase